MNENNMRELFFNGSLTLMSILLGVFTLALANATYLKGESEAVPWYVLCLISGISVITTSLVCYGCFQHKWTTFIRYAFPVTLFLCGIGIPVVGAIIFFRG
jgi:hypothetical protein